MVISSFKKENALFSSEHVRESSKAESISKRCNLKVVWGNYYDVNKLNSARIGKIFARWPLALAITSISLGDDWGYRVTEMWDKKKKTKIISFKKLISFILKVTNALLVRCFCAMMAKNDFAVWLQRVHLIWVLNSSYYFVKFALKKGKKILFT